MLAALIPAVLVLFGLVAASALLAAASEVSRVVWTRRHSAEGIDALQRMLADTELPPKLQR